MNTTIFSERESNVRSYCRSFPVVFDRAVGSLLYTEEGQHYIDFFSGAGTLNYGHNNPFIKQRILDYVASDRIMHGLDMHTVAKRAFLERFTSFLDSKDLSYKIQFCGPTGANAVEAALKLARKIKQRTNIFSFMGAYHGVSLGSLAVTGGRGSRQASGVPLDNVTFMPYPHGFMTTFDSIKYIDAVLSDAWSGIDKPAAMIVETIQAEGGVIVAPVEWLQQLRAVCDQHEILLICDDIQVGCCRTGSFFSFERAGIVPDLVTLSKSVSGYGLPMALLLMKPDLDQWAVAEHTGTFRGNQLAFIGATAALDFLEQEQLEAQVRHKEQLIRTFLQDRVVALDARIQVRGSGMIWGIDLSKVERPGLAGQLARQCFEQGLVIETVGRDDSVLKILPPLVIEEQLLTEGLGIIASTIQDSLA